MLRNSVLDRLRRGAGQRLAAKHQRRRQLWASGASAAASVAAAPSSVQAGRREQLC